MVLRFQVHFAIHVTILSLPIVLIAVPLRKLICCVYRIIHLHRQIRFRKLILNVLFDCPINNEKFLINVRIPSSFSYQNDQEIFRDQPDNLIIHVKNWEPVVR
jgi:hypothetical protein